MNNGHEREAQAERESSQGAMTFQTRRHSIFLLCWGYACSRGEEAHAIIILLHSVSSIEQKVLDIGSVNLVPITSPVKDFLTIV